MDEPKQHMRHAAYSRISGPRFTNTGEPPSPPLDRATIRYASMDGIRVPDCAAPGVLAAVWSRSAIATQCRDGLAPAAFMSAPPAACRVLEAYDFLCDQDPGSVVADLPELSVHPAADRRSPPRSFSGNAILNDRIEAVSRRGGSECRRSIRHWHSSVYLLWTVRFDPSAILNCLCRHVAVSPPIKSSTDGSGDASARAL
jgi:hypothetical protein